MWWTEPATSEDLVCADPVGTEPFLPGPELWFQADQWSLGEVPGGNNARSSGGSWHELLTRKPESEHQLRP